jgi:hypothetical protein
MIKSFIERESTVKELNLVSNLLDYAEYRSNIETKTFKKLCKYRDRVYKLIQDFDSKNLDKPKNNYKGELK